MNFSMTGFLCSEHAERAIEIITSILPQDHLLLASSKRVKGSQPFLRFIFLYGQYCTHCVRIQCFHFLFSALILEEIAIDSPDEASKRLLAEAQELHLTSLTLALKAFGENNVQTAKHYGNLGRLYQSMGKYQVSWHFLLWFLYPISL
jgi:hypothetical protein